MTIFLCLELHVFSYILINAQSLYFVYNPQNYGAPFVTLNTNISIDIDACVK